MKFRNKLFTAALTLTLAIGTSVTAFAATKDDVISALEGAGASSSQIASARSYLDSSASDDSNYDDIIAQINTVGSIMRSAGTTHMSQLSASDKAKVMAAIQAASGDIKGNYSYSSNGVALKDGNGNTILSTGSDGTVSGNSMQHTSTNYGDLMVFGSILVLGAAGTFALRNKKSVSNN